MRSLWWLLLLGMAFQQTALSQTPTPAQLEAFRNLPRDQQRSVLDAIGGRGRGASESRRDAPLSVPETTEPSTAQDAQIPSVPRIGGRSTVILSVDLVDEVGEDSGATAARRDRIMAGNPYRLDGDGRLLLPSLPVINMAGLTDTQAAQLLNADPRLAGMRFSVTLLPVESVGMDALRPFGYDLFDRVPTTFAPATDIPVPSDYLVGPGDNINVDLFGKKTEHNELVVDRNGALFLPQFGPVQVSGLSFDQVREEIERRVAEQMIGTRASVTMGQLRSIRIFVVGDVVRPGTYTVSGLSSITNALFASGGVAAAGSLRDIELKRGGRSIAKFDLYDLLLRGDTSKDLPLEQGDAIFVPPLRKAAGIGGEVRRPAIYEFRKGTTVGDLMELSGGLMPSADPRAATLTRINAYHERLVLSLDLSSNSDRARELLPGDLVSVPRVMDDVRGVMLEGFVHRPGAHAWVEGMRLTDVLGSLQMMKSNADQRYVLIRRERLPDRRVEVESADATKAFAARGSDADPPLKSGDRVMVFSRQPDRGPALSDLLRDLRLQTRDNQPMPVVSINGRVRAPGQYPLEPNMTVADLLRAGGGLEDAAFASTVELTRYAVVNNESRKTEVLTLNLGEGTAADSARMPLRAYDVVVVKETPEWREQEFVVLRGEVRFPGTYPIRQRETLSSVVKRAGGLTAAAFADGSVFTREELKAQERRQIETLANRLEADIASFNLANSQALPTRNDTEAVTAGQALLSQLRSTKPVGRLVIDLDTALSGVGSEDDIELLNGDELIVPRRKQYVTVVGEVQNPTSHVWRSGIERDSYIEQSGGTTLRADMKRIYVVRADGSVVSKKAQRWFGREDLEAGDTIVVPADIYRPRTLPVLQSVTTVIYNLAVAVAAIGSL